MRLLLDTDAYSSFKRGHPAVAALLKRADDIVFSPIVAGELLHGFRGGSRFDQNLLELEQFLGNPFVRVVPVSMQTAERFGRIAVSLRRKGRAIPVNDIWIAAQAMETGADLLSFDRHFGDIDGLVWRVPGQSDG